MPHKLSFDERRRLIERFLAGESVTKLCQETGISRTLFYRFLERYKKEGSLAFSPRGSGRPSKQVEKVAKSYPKLSAPERLQIVKEILEKGKRVKEVAEEYGISRITIYKWLKRYKAAPEDKKLLALERRKPDIERYFRQTPEKYEKAVLSLIAKFPQYGIRRIVRNLPKIAGVPVVGHHGVQNILRRQKLLTFEQRRIRAQAQRTSLVWATSHVLEIVSSFFRIPVHTRHRIIRLASVFAFTAFVTVVVLGLAGYLTRLLIAQPVSTRLGLVLAANALFMGSIFFLYSIKYYLTLAIVLSFSQQDLGTEGPSAHLGLKRRGFLDWLLGPPAGGGDGPSTGSGSRAVGLTPNLEHLKLKRYPKVAIHIPFYNEKNVVERAIAASTNFDYPGPPAGGYEVVLCDDSTDETTQIIRNYLQKFQNSKHPKLQATRGEGWELTSAEVRPGVTLKHLHRTSRNGFKGGALKKALELTDKDIEFICVFDADFVPYPDTLELFLKYFQATTGTLDFRKVNSGQWPVNSGKSPNTKHQTPNTSNIAAVQGYQWHVLNKSENWITRGIRSEYSGSYVIERSGTEIYGGLKMISGAVYMIRRDVLEEVGWETSITEDFQLTLKLYEKGYKVVYTPYIQAPAECVSTLKRLIRQRMRWAEGHSNNIRRMFIRLMLGKWEEKVDSKRWTVNSKSKNTEHRTPNPEHKKVFIPSPLTLSEKLEFLYLGPYYLQAFFFLVGTISWLISETVFPTRLPFWTSLWGWSLVLTNMLSLPLMNAVGMFLEESEERDYFGLLSFAALSYVLVPFQAYASLKGLFQKEEGHWFRTPKTGRITDILKRGTFYRFISGILPGRAPAIRAQSLATSLKPLTSNYLALSTANSQFNSFNIVPRGKRAHWLGRLLIVVFLAISTTLASFAPYIQVAKDMNVQGPNSGFIVLPQYKQSSKSGFNKDFSLVKEIHAASKTQFTDESFVQKVERMQLEGKKTNFLASETPVFILKERKTLTSLILSWLKSFSGEKKQPLKERVSVKLLDGKDDEIGGVETEEKEEDVLEISIEPDREFKPGRYEVIVTEGEYSISQDFTWGVLAINTNKSIYLPGDEVYIQMAALWDDGHTICNANLQLEIISPSGQITRPQIQRSDDCGPDNLTDIPDYFATYQTDKSGRYEMKLINLDNNYEITDFFEVHDFVPFDIERNGPTRINPKAEYPVTFMITANQDYRGIVEEIVPASFEIPQSVNEGEKSLQEPLEIIEAHEEKRIMWFVDWKKGGTYQLNYIFNAPSKSPEFYLLGPLWIGDFKEARQWQIAADAPDVPVIENYTEQWDTNPSTTLTFSKPSGVQVGEFLLIIAVNDDTSATAFSDNKSGWNFIANFGDGTSDSHVGLFWRIASGAEDATEQVTSAGSDEWGGWYVRISGVDTDNPINAVGTQTTLTGSSVTASAVTTDVDDCLALCFGSFDGGDGNNTAPFSVSGTGWSYEDDGSSGTSGFSDASGVWGKKSMTGTQGSTLNATISSDGTSDGLVGAQIAIAPGAPAGDVTVGTTPDNQTANILIPSTDNHVGGAFKIVENTSSRNVTSITIAEQGSVDADGDLANVELWYENDTSDPYDCEGEDFSGFPSPSETRLGSTTTFNASDEAAFTGTVGISTTSTMCAYIILDVDSDPTEDQTLEIEITDPPNDVVVSGGGSVGPSSPRLIPGTTYLKNPGVVGSVGKTTDSWCGAIPVYMELVGVDEETYPHARAKVDTPATETYYTSMSWDSGDSRFEGTIYIGSWYCNGCDDPNTGNYDVTVQLDNDSGFGSIDYSDALSSAFSTFVTRKKSGEDNSTNYTDILPVWNTDHWDIAVNDLTIAAASGTHGDVAVAFPFIPSTASINNLAVEFEGTSVSEGSPESTSDAWWWDSNTHTLYLLIDSLTSTENTFDVNLDFDSDTDLWATRFDHVRTKDMGTRDFYNGLYIGNQYITTSVYGGAGEGGQPAWEGSGEQAESHAKPVGGGDENTIDCMERVAVVVDDVNNNCDSSGYYPCNIKWKPDEWDDMLVSEDNGKLIIEVNHDDNGTTGWEQYRDYSTGVKRTQVFYAGERYIKNVYEITNSDSSAHDLPLLWGREQWLSSDQGTNDRGRADGDSVDRTIESRLTVSSLTCPWFTAYDTSAYNAMGVISRIDDPADYGYFLTYSPLQSSVASVEWPVDYAQSGTNAEDTYFEKDYPSVAAGDTVTFTFWQWGYDTTSWANIESAIEEDCLEVNRIEPRTCWSCQRKTLYDSSDEVFWRFSYDESEIDFDYNSNPASASWTAATSLAYKSNDFSVWDDDTYVYLAYYDDYDIKVRRGTLNSSSISWDGSSYVALDGSGASSTYQYANVTQDSSGYLWVLARYYNGTNYYIRAVKSSSANNPSSWGTVYDLSSTSNTDKNVYGTISSLGSHDMYVTWIRDTAIEGKKWTNSSSSWDGSATSIGTGKSSLSSNISMSSDSGNNLHLAYVDGGDYVQYKEYSSGSWDASPTRLDSSATNEYVTVSVDTNPDPDEIYVIYLRSGTAYYKKYDTSWGSETNTNWTEGTEPKCLTSNYSDPGSIYAQWTSDHAPPYTLHWEYIIVIPEHLWIFFGLGPILPLVLRRKRRK